MALLARRVAIRDEYLQLVCLIHAARTPSVFTVGIDQLPRLILVQPNRIRIPGNGLFRWQIIVLLWTGHALLPTMSEKCHVGP